MFNYVCVQISFDSTSTSPFHAENKNFNFKNGSYSGATAYDVFE